MPARCTHRLFARDWQASAVFTAQSGRPFTPRVSFDNSNTGNVGGGTFAYDRPNVVQGIPPAGTRTVTYFVFDPRSGAFAPSKFCFVVAHATGGKK